MTPKTFRLQADQILPVATGYGACLASDRITVDGAPVGYCYRETPDFAQDSGWRFLAGDEDQDYADNPDNWSHYDINTIANYDPAIALVLDAPVGSQFERSRSGVLVPASVA
jgi:hypothetical protein